MAYTVLKLQVLLLCAKAFSHYYAIVVGEGKYRPRHLDQQFCSVHPTDERHANLSPTPLIPNLTNSLCSHLYSHAIVHLLGNFVLA